MKQRIGDITGSKDVTAVQRGVEGSDQEIGNIHTSEGVNLFQATDDRAALVDALEIGAALAARLRRIPDLAAPVLAEEVARLVQQEVSRPITSDLILNAVAEAETHDDIPSTIRDVLRDASVAVSLVSGTFALAALGAPTAVIIGVPAALGISGVLAGSKIRSLYDWIGTRLKDWGV